MSADKLNHRAETNTSSGNPYFEFKATLQRFIIERKWSSLIDSSYNMLAVFPEEDFGWFALGLAFSRLGDFSSAAINLKKALYINPNMTSAYYQLGITYYRNNDYLNAIKYFELALEKGMHTHFLYYNMGNTWYKLNNNEFALQCYIKSLSICHSYTPAAYGLFQIYFGKKDYQNAVSSLSSVINNNKLPSYLLAQAKLLYENESEINTYKLRKAKKILTSAIEIDNNFALAYYERAYVRSKLLDLCGYLEDKAVAFKLNPELKDGHTSCFF